MYVGEGREDRVRRRGEGQADSGYLARNCSLFHLYKIYLQTVIGVQLFSSSFRNTHLSALQIKMNKNNAIKLLEMLQVAHSKRELQEVTFHVWNCQAGQQCWVYFSAGASY